MRQRRRGLSKQQPGVTDRNMRKATPAPASRRTKRLHPVGIRLEPELRESLEALAEADNRTLSDYCRVVLKLHAEQQDRKAK